MSKFINIVTQNEIIFDKKNAKKHNIEKLIELKLDHPHLLKYKINHNEQYSYQKNKMINLKQYIENNQNLGGVIIKSIILQIIQTLKYLYQNRVAHLNLTTQNIFVINKGTKIDIKLANYGIDQYQGYRQNIKIQNYKMFIQGIFIDIQNLIIVLLQLILNKRNISLKKLYQLKSINKYYNLCDLLQKIIKKSTQYTEYMKINLNQYQSNRLFVEIKSVSINFSQYQTILDQFKSIDMQEVQLSQKIQQAQNQFKNKKFSSVFQLYEKIFRSYPIEKIDNVMKIWNLQSTLVQQRLKFIKSKILTNETQKINLIQSIQVQKLQEKAHKEQNSEKRSEYYNFIGIVLSEKKSFQKALKFFDQAIKINNKNSKFYFNRGLAFLNIQNLKKAQQDFKSSYSIFQTNSTLINIANIQFYCKNYKKALQIYNQLINKQVKQYSIYYNRAIINQEFQKLQQAISDYTYAIDKNPQFKEAYLNRAILYMKMQSLEKAKQDLDHLQKNKYESHLLELNMGNYYYLTNNYQKAKILYQNSLKIKRTSQAQQNSKLFSQYLHPQNSFNSIQQQNTTLF